MVKGISRQVIVVRTPEAELFEQAIFILKDDAVHSGITEEALMKEAMQTINKRSFSKRRVFYLYGAFGAISGGLIVSMIWLVSTFLF